MRCIGRGRGATVYLKDGNAYKVFNGSFLAGIVNTICLGVPNPYRADMDARQSAYYQRCVLKELFEFWTDGNVSVAEPISHHWDDQHRANVLEAEFIHGRHARFDNGELSDIIAAQNRLIPHLKEAGFVGALWQAGLGNPAATANFLLDGRKAVCVDLESGVPPLCAVHLFYLAEMLKRKKILFDDVDSQMLLRYIKKNKDVLQQRLGHSRTRQLENDINSLLAYNGLWKSKTRAEMSLEYMHSQGYVDDDALNYYSNRPIRWTARQVTLYPEIGTKKAKEKVKKTWQQAKNFLASLTARDVLYGISVPFRTSYKMLFSRKFKEEVGKKYISSRLAAWKDRITDEKHGALRQELEHYRNSEYVGDAVVMLLKPFSKAVQYIGFPALGIAGAISPYEAALGAVFFGGITRMAYMSFRTLQNIAALRKPPLVGLLFSGIPCIGTYCFAFQMHAADRDKELPKFIFKDLASMAGKNFPVYGGEYSRIEYAAVSLMKKAFEKELPFKGVDMIPGLGLISFGARTWKENENGKFNSPGQLWEQVYTRVGIIPYHAVTVLMCAKAAEYVRDIWAVLR